jgi:hypothetical protein
MDPAPILPGLRAGIAGRDCGVPLVLNIVDRVLRDPA